MKSKNILKVETPNDFAQREMTIETDTVTNVALMMRVVNVSLRPLFILQKCKIILSFITKPYRISQIFAEMFF